MTTAIKNTFNDTLAATAERLAHQGNSYIRDQRREAFARFSEMGIPGRKDEEYKYSNIKPFLKDGMTIDSEGELTSQDLDKILAPLSGALRMVFVNGTFAPGLSSKISEKGLTISNLSEDNPLVNNHLGHYADSSADAFIAMNTALWNDGLLIHFHQNCVLEKPLYLVNVAVSDRPRTNQSRVLILAEDGSSGTIIQQFETIKLSAISFTNIVTEVVLKGNAMLHHYILENECENGVLVNTTQACLNGHSTYHINTVTTDGAFVRNNLNIVLNEPRCEAHLYGLYTGNKKALIDNHTLVDHRMPDCNSNELYKGIMNDRSTGVFNGKIFVRQDAQRTNAFQSNKNILLSDDSSINTKPQLEIYADDVKCSHGSSTGSMDQEALFYLRARGLSEETAKKLMMQAFADDVINNIRQQDFREFVKAIVVRNIS